jgi:hypothetical protein
MGETLFVSPGGGTRMVIMAATPRKDGPRIAAIGTFYSYRRTGVGGGFSPFHTKIIYIAAYCLCIVEILDRIVQYLKKGIYP